MLASVFSCESDFSFSSSSSSIAEQENPSPDKISDKPKAIPIRKSIVSDKLVWQETNKTAEDQGPWQRKFELQINAFMSKASESNTEKFDFLVSKYRSLTNVLKTNDLHPGMSLENFNIIRIKNSGIKKHYADTNKTELAKEEFFEMEQSILIFTKDGQTTNRVIYYQGKTNKIKENVYLENGGLKTILNPLKNQNIVGLGSVSADTSKWGVYGAYYRKLVGAAHHQNTIAIPRVNYFNGVIESLYGVEGYVKATLSSYGINTQTTLKNAIVKGRHLRILKANIVGESQEYTGDFLSPKLPKGNHDIVKFTFAFEDWKVPDDKNKGGEGSGDYNDGELIVVVGKKQRVSAGNFSRMWNAHPGERIEGDTTYCPLSEAGCAAHFSDVVFTSNGLGINIEAWKHYMKSKSPLKLTNNHKTKPITSYVWTTHQDRQERVIKAVEIFYFLKEVIFDHNNSFNVPNNRNDKSTYANKRGLVFFENCWPNGTTDHIDIWDGEKYSNVGEFKYWGKYNDDPFVDKGNFSPFPVENCPIYFLEFSK